MSGDRILWAVVLVGEPRGWLVEAATATGAEAIVRRTVPLDAEDRLLTWTAKTYLRRYRIGDDFGPGWSRLPRPASETEPRAAVG